LFGKPEGNSLFREISHMKLEVKIKIKVIIFPINANMDPIY
jgi:hypothetical protein